MEALRQEFVKARALREMETERRLLRSRQRLQRCRQTLSAAWSPWACGSGRQGCNDPPGWEISCHKDQRMRQASFVLPSYPSRADWEIYINVAQADFSEGISNVMQH